MTAFPRPPRAPDPRAPADIARWQRDLSDYLARAVAVITEASSGLTDKQDADPTLSALAGLDGSAGLVEQTGSDTFTKRALGVGAATSVLTRAAGDGRYDTLGSADAAVTAHEGEADPHTQYVRGPASATDNAVARFDGATGKLAQDGPVTIDDNGVLAGFRFGTHSALGAETVTGFITITDADGASRKLAVVS